jgi:hypothetical protein
VNEETWCIGRAPVVREGRKAVRRSSSWRPVGGGGVPEEERFLVRLDLFAYAVRDGRPGSNHHHKKFTEIAPVGTHLNSQQAKARSRAPRGTVQAKAPSSSISHSN